MKLLPYDTFTIETPEPLPIVLERLAARIEPEQPIRWQFSRNHAPYEGTLSEAGFEIRRIIHHRNSFLPLIRGRFETSPSGTSVRLTMGLHPVVIAFLVVLYLAWYGFFVPIWLTGAMPTALALQFLGLPIAVLLVFWCAFWVEVARSRRELVEIISGRPHRHRSGIVSRWLPKALQWVVFFLGLAKHNLALK